MGPHQIKNAHSLVFAVGVLLGRAYWLIRIRLGTPLIREGGSLIPTDWETALNEVVKRLKELLDVGQPDYLAITFHDYCKQLLERFAALYDTLNLIGQGSVYRCPRTVVARLVLGAEGPRSIDPRLSKLKGRSL